MLGRLAAWFLADALGPHLVGRAVDGLGGRPTDFAPQMLDLVRTTHPVASRSRGRRQLLQVFDSDEAWSVFVYPTPEHFDKLADELRLILGLEGDETVVLLDSLCAQFLTCLEPSLGVAVAEYRREQDHGRMYELLKGMEKQLLDLAPYVAPGGTSVVIEGDHNVVHIGREAIGADLDPALDRKLQRLAGATARGLVYKEAAVQLQVKWFDAAEGGLADE
jgi:hypothetical protein